MLRRHGWWLVAVALFALWLWSQQPADRTLPQTGGTSPPVLLPDEAGQPRHPVPGGDSIPREAFDTLALIQRGGPFPHRQDDGTFQNRERLLPQRERGWYREYTVRTPGSRDRGARRIVTGGDPPSEYYYTADHYRSFRRFDPGSGRLQGGRLQ